MPARRARRQVLATMALLAGFMLLAWRLGWGINYPDAPGPNPPDRGFQGGTTPESSADLLRRGLRMADDSLKTLESIPDYSFTMRKQERVDGTLLERETIEIKVRHSPFSVYAKHTAPERLKGQEAIYVAGKHDNCMVAHGAGFLSIKTVTIPTDGWLAMQGNRHPITSAGMKNLLLKLKELAVTQREYLATCELRFLEGQYVDGRPCECLEIHSPRPGKTSRLALARIYLDKGWNVPVKYEAWEFPPGDDTGEPILIEYYEYLNVRLKVGLTDADFDPANPSFQFPAWGRGT
jgi:hypothetical protein